MTAPSVIETPVGEYLRRLASSAAVPGGGSAAAVAAAMGAALLSMVSKIGAKKARQKQDGETLLSLVPEFDQLSERLGRLSQDDIDAYRSVVETRNASLRDSGHAEALVKALERATSVPLETATLASHGLALAARVRPLAWEMTVSDLETGHELLRTGFVGAMANVAINLPDLQGEARTRIEREYQELSRRQPG